MANGNGVSTSLWLTDLEHKVAADYAREHNTSKNYVIRLALRQFLYRNGAFDDPENLPVPGSDRAAARV